MSWYLQRDVDNQSDFNHFSRERTLSKLKVQESGRKMSGFVKESFTLQNFPDSKVFGYKVPTLNSEFKISGDATKPERFYCGFVHPFINGKTNPVPKRSGFVTNPEKSPLV